MDCNPRRDDAHGTFVAPSVRLQRRCRKAQITIEILESNSSSESRFAKITIVCGSYRIAIEIEQKGHGSDNPDNPNDPDDPDTPPTDYKYVARVDYKLTDNREEGATTTVSQSFDYDEEKQSSPNYRKLPLDRRILL